MNAKQNSFFSLPTNILVLCAVGFLINISTTMVYSQLAMFMKNVLETSAFQATVIDGIVESISHFTRIASGAISDFLRQRKSVLLAGYSLALLAKPIFVFASSIWWIFIAQSFDRLSNGIQASPRDALVGDSVEKSKRGASYGLLRSVRTAGSFIGALIAMGIMVYARDDFRLVFGLAVLPALAAFILLYAKVQEPNKEIIEKKSKKHFAINREHLRALGKPFWKLIFLASFFELSHFSESLLSWRAHEIGVPTSYVAFVMVVMNVGQFLVAYPLGWLSDKFNRRNFLGIGFLFMVGATLCLGLGKTIPLIMIGILLWGAQMGTTQSIFLSMISDVVPKELRGTAFGIFYFTTGVSFLISSGIAGKIWDHCGSGYTFLTSSFVSIFAFFLVFGILKPKAFQKV
jgi:MFS family permease